MNVFITEGAFKHHGKDMRSNDKRKKMTYTLVDIYHSICLDKTGIRRHNWRHAKDF